MYSYNEPKTVQLQSNKSVNNKNKPTLQKSKEIISEKGKELLSSKNNNTKNSNNSTNLSTTVSSEFSILEKSPKVDKVSYGAIPRPFFKPSNNLSNNYKSFKIERDYVYEEYDKVISEISPEGLNEDSSTSINHKIRLKEEYKKLDKLHLRDRKEFIIDRIKIEEHMEKLNLQFNKTPQSIPYPPNINNS